MSGDLQIFFDRQVLQKKSRIFQALIFRKRIVCKNGRIQK
jgi:hypothetical protein